MTPELDRALSGHFAEHRDLDAVRFSALLYGDALELAAGANALRRATAWALESGGVSGARIWDSAGQEHVIVSATPEMDLGETGITRWVGLSFRLAGPRAITFDEFARSSATRTWWGAMGRRWRRRVTSMRCTARWSDCIHTICSSPDPILTRPCAASGAAMTARPAGGSQ